VKNSSRSYKTVWGFYKNMKNKEKWYITPTFHPTGEVFLNKVSVSYNVIFYNYYENDRIIKISNYDFLDLNLFKIRFRKLDFAITNTWPLFMKVLKERPSEIITEDYLYALPYLIAGKLIGSKLIYYNCSASSKSTRVRNLFINYVKRNILMLFSEYRHGFHGAESYLNSYLPQKKSILWPWPLQPKRTVKTQRDMSCMKILYVGEFIDRKRIEKVISLYEHITAQNTSKIEMKLVGARKNQFFYNSQTCERPHKEVVEDLLDADVLLLLSKREAMGGVVFEALSCGAYVFLSKEVGANQIIKTASQIYTDNPLIEYMSELGCIVDAEYIQPEHILSILEEQKEIILNRKSQRILSIAEYLI